MPDGEFSSTMQAAIDAATERIEGAPQSPPENEDSPAAEGATGETQNEQQAETPDSKPVMFKIKGRELSEEDIEEALLSHRNLEKRRAKQERQSQEIAQSKRDYEAKLAELDRRLQMVQPKQGDQEEPDEDSELVDRIANSVFQRLQYHASEKEAQGVRRQQAENDQASFESHLEETAKEYGVSSDALFRRFFSMSKPPVSLDDAAMEVRAAQKSSAHKGGQKTKQPAPAPARPGGPSVARIISPTISADKIPQLGTPEFEAFAESHMRGLVAAANG
jgi:hypothetical protein